MFEYLPLKVGESTAKLSLQSSDLGVYQYELHLVATPSPPERLFHFTTHLGLSHQQHCGFVSYAKGRTEYTCKASFMTNFLRPTFLNRDLKLSDRHIKFF